MVRVLTLIGVAIFTSGTAHAAGLDLSLSGDSAQVLYLFDSDSQIGIGGTDIGAGLFFNENDDYLLNASIMVSGNSTGRNRALQLGAGAKVVLGELDLPENDSVAAIAIGGKISYVFPSGTPMALTTEFYYAPDITSFGDNEDFLEYSLRFDIEVAPTTRFYVGYRKLETEIENTDIEYELDDDVHLGVRFSF